MKEVQEKIDFSFYYFLNFYLGREKASNGMRKISNPIYKRRHTKQMIAISNSPNHSPVLKSITIINDLEFKNVFKNYNIQERVLECHQSFIEPKNNTPLMTSAFLKKKALKTEEEFTQMDDNDIINELTNFTGVMRLWHSMSLNEK